jgi:hypothetical protein
MSVYRKVGRSCLCNSNPWCSHSREVSHSQEVSRSHEVSQPAYWFVPWLQFCEKGSLERAMKLGKFRNKQDGQPDMVSELFN